MEEKMTMGDLCPGQKGIILKVGGAKTLRRRIMDMGVVKGAEVEMVRYAPLGDPMEFVVKGYHLSLRREEAGEVEIELEIEHVVEESQA
jgi:Fe2+ transport system protein FeoA